MNDVDSVCPLSTGSCLWVQGLGHVYYCTILLLKGYFPIFFKYIWILISRHYFANPVILFRCEDVHPPLYSGFLVLRVTSVREPLLLKRGPFIWVTLPRSPVVSTLHGNNQDWHFHWQIVWKSTTYTSTIGGTTFDRFPILHFLVCSDSLISVKNTLSRVRQLGNLVYFYFRSIPYPPSYINLFPSPWTRRGD